MTRDEKLAIIRNERFTDYQAQTIYEEMGISAMDNEEQIIDAAMEWYNNEVLYERSVGV